MFRQTNGRDGYSLLNALGRTGVIEKLAILAKDTPDMLVTQNQDVIQAFTADTADEPQQPLSSPR